MTTKENYVVIPLMGYHDADTKLCYILGQPWHKEESPMQRGFSARIHSAQTIPKLAECVQCAGQCEQIPESCFQK